MLQRSTWSGLILSAAVTVACGLGGGMTMGQETAPAATAAAADAGAATGPTSAPAVNLKNLADDFMHYSLVNNMELAKANGQAILNANPEPKDLLAAFEDSANGRNPREIMLQNQKRPELKDVSAQLLDRLEGGYRAVARDPVRIRADIERLSNGPRAYNNAREHLTAAGPFAAPLFIEYLQNDSQKALHPYIFRVMGEIGRPLLLPLLADLQTNDPAIRVELVKVIGEIGYPQALPALRSIQANSDTGSELKTAADTAINLIDRSGRSASAAPADLYMHSAQEYYDKKPSYEPMSPDEATNPLWTYDKGLNNVQAVSVPTPIWNDLMALRQAGEALKLDANNPAALSLWIAAALRRDIDLPKGATDPTQGKDKLDSAFYALAAGPMYVNPVLSGALDSHNTALAIRAIDALESTGGISGLVSANSGAPLIRALSYPDRAVRYRAAFALARANPAKQFPSYFRVVPILADAIAATGSPNALVIESDDDKRNRIADLLRNGSGHYSVFAAATLASALEQARNATAFDVVVVGHGPEVPAVSASNDYRLAGVPVLVATPGTDIQAIKDSLATGKGMQAIDETTADDAAITAAVTAARADLGSSPMDAAANTQYATTALDLLKSLAADHKTIYNVADALPALEDAIRGKQPEIASAAAGVLGQLNNSDAQKALATAALSTDAAADARVTFFNNLAESAKHTGNALDSAQIASIIKVVGGDADANVRTAAARALGALNVPSNQASALILEQIK